MSSQGWFSKLNKKLELHQKIIPIIVVCFSVLIILTIIVTSYANYFFGLKHAKQSLKEKYEIVSNAIIKHGPLLDKMVGDKRQNYKIIREEFLRQQPNIRIIRNEKIDELYGKESPQYYAKDELERKVLKEGNEVIVREGFELRGVFPIKPNIECLRCHYNVGEKEVIGVISIVIPVEYIFSETKLVTLVYIFLGLGGILTAALAVYFTYMKIAHQPLESVVKVLDKIAEGDLTVEVPAVFKEREDMIGRLSKAVDKVLEYMKNFTSKILDYSVKLVDQVDNVFRLVDSVNEKIKFQNLQVAQTSIISEDFALTVGSISRNTSAINNIAKEILAHIEKLKEAEVQEQSEILVKIFGLLEGLNTKVLEIAEDLDKGLKTSESINEAFEEITQVSNEISQLMDKMSENAYETLLISSYMKTIASTVKTKKMEEMLFELFEKDIDRYMLRLQAHIKGIDRLDPERWGDYQAFPLGKWYYSEEGQSLKQMVQDFDFDEFESLLKNFHNVGKDLIVAYNQEDSIKVEKLQVQLRGIARRLKLLLDELREHYSKIKTL